MKQNLCDIHVLIADADITDMKQIASLLNLRSFGALIVRISNHSSTIVKRWWFVLFDRLCYNVQAQITLIKPNLRVHVIQRVPWALAAGQKHSAVPNASRPCKLTFPKSLRLPLQRPPRINIFRRFFAVRRQTHCRLQILQISSSINNKHTWQMQLRLNRRALLKRWCQLHEQAVVIALSQITLCNAQIAPRNPRSL